MLFKIILELLLERKYLPKQAKELVISVYPTINSKQSNKNIIFYNEILNYFVKPKMQIFPL